MIIDDNIEKISVCCYQMMNRLLYTGIERDWTVCPYCGEPIQYIVEE